MSFSRREFLTVSALALPATLAITKTMAQDVPTPSPRMRLEEFIKEPARLASLKRGVEVMKSRLPSEPGSWFYQGAIHAVTDEAIQAAKDADPNVANVNQGKFWNQCPHFGQNSAAFLLWHRGYIYHFEKFLREASGDPNLSLPYWNYTDPTQRTFPAEFADEDRDQVSQRVRNPLYDSRREQAFAYGLYELTERVAGTGFLFTQVDFFGSNEASGLAGGVRDSSPRTKGLIEQQPHDLLHFAIGGSIGTGEASEGDAASGIMANVRTAAFDPIFWIHHCNIDRIWTVWECLSNPPRRWGTVPPKEWLDAKPWFFNDTDGTVANHPRSYYLDRRNFQVAYDSDVAGSTPLSATEPGKEPGFNTGVTAGPAGAAGAPFGIPKDAKSFVLRAEVAQTDTKVRVSPDKGMSFKGSIKTPLSLEGGKLRSSVLLTPGKLRRLMLEIQGIEIEGVTSVGFDVFVNLPEGKTASRDLPNYVGTISLFGANHSHGSDHGSNDKTQRFDITRLLAQPGFDEKNVTLTIEPFDLLQPKGNVPRLRRPVGISYTGFRVIVLEGSSDPPM